MKLPASILVPMVTTVQKMEPARLATRQLDAKLVQTQPLIVNRANLAI
jgi:hypothetical protein